MRTLIGALVASAVVAGTLPAQGRLDGIVREGRSLLGIACYPVVLIDSTGAAIDSTYTRAGGHFSLGVPRTGSYRLRVGHRNYFMRTTPPLPLRGDSALTRFLTVPLAEGASSELALAILPIGPTNAPEYPYDMLDRHLEGDVVMAFVVDTSGGVDSASAIPLRATHTYFLRAVERALPRMRFQRWTEPTGRGCLLAVQRFEFNINRR